MVSPLLVVVLLIGPNQYGTNHDLNGQGKGDDKSDCFLTDRGDP